MGSRNSRGAPEEAVVQFIAGGLFGLMMSWLSFVRATFAAKPKTLAYYENGAKALLGFERLADEPLDAITSDRVAKYVSRRQQGKGKHGRPLQIASLNRELQVLRRMFHLAQEWLRAENVADGMLEIQYGKTDNARRRIPMTPRVQATLNMRLSKADGSAWVFPALTKSGHIEPSSLKKQHVKAIAEATRILREEIKRDDVQFASFELYALRHTCLTRWAPHMDPWTLAYLAGHRDMNITKSYVDPQEQTIREAMGRVQLEKSGHTSGHTTPQADLRKIPASGLSF